MAVQWVDLTSAQQQNAKMVARATKMAFAVNNRDTQITMLAIAGAESGYDPRKRGDALANQTGSNKTACTSINCGGYCSHGVWQIFVAWHYDKIMASGGPDARYLPCEAVEWLYNPYNSALIAKRIMDSSGLTAWTVYRNSSTGAVPNHLAWMTVAETAMSIVENEDEIEPPPPPPNGDDEGPNLALVFGSGALLFLMWLFLPR